jgi:galactokinase
LERLALQMDPLIRKRCRHVISENERVRQSVQWLRAGDLEQFGQLMNASHQSLKFDYEVSCQELDLMVETAGQQPGVFGSRMTGAGFGGCTVSLVKNDSVASFVSQVKERYQKTGFSADLCLRYFTAQGSFMNLLKISISGVRGIVEPHAGAGRKLCPGLWDLPDSGQILVCRDTRPSGAMVRSVISG